MIVSTTIFSVIFVNEELVRGYTQYSQVVNNFFFYIKNNVKNGFVMLIIIHFYLQNVIKTAH